MKKLLVIPVALLALSGCTLGQKDAQVNAPVAEQAQNQQQVQNLDNVDVPSAPVVEETIVTEVAPIDNYNSSDELLEDIDAMMNELDTL